MMTKQEKLYAIRRELALLSYRADHLKPGSHRETLVAKMGRRLIVYAFVLVS